VLLKGELILQCVLRQPNLPFLDPAREIQSFGAPDAADMVGESPAAWGLRRALDNAAATDDHVMIHGESGTGKELAAQAIHALSTRAKGPWVSRVASAFTDTLLESELYGNPANYPNKGQPARKGLIGTAHLGTFFLDEIADLDLKAQADLLRVLTLGEYQQVGEAITRQADVRVIGAHNKDDSELRRLLRDDFRLRFVKSIRVPPLRERREDIPLLIRHLVLERAKKFPRLVNRFIREGARGRLDVRISLRLVDYLVRHPLPGNARELLAILVKAIDESPGSELRMPTLDPSPTPPPATPVEERAASPAAPAKSTLPPPAAAVEEAPQGYVPPGSPSKATVMECLKREAGVLARAARALGLERNALYRLMRAYGIKLDGLV
jgi:DNA-binding NtrC family response regulator